MDWSKAKTILIVSFIIVNILLVYTYLQDSEEVDVTLKEDFIEDTIKLLNNKNIKIKTEIPKEDPKLRSLIVEYENLDISKLNLNFYNDKGTIKSKSEDLIELIYEDENTTIINKKILMYKSDVKEIKYDISSEEEAVQIALDFLKNRKLDVNDMVLSFVKKKDKTYYLEFSKIYEDKYLGTAFTNIQLDNSGIRRMERLWLNVIEKGESEIYISSAPKSILALLSMDEVYGKTITDISLSYYFDPEKHEYIQDPKEAQEGRTVPAWRVEFEDGYKVFIDIY